MLCAVQNCGIDIASVGTGCGSRGSAPLNFLPVISPSGHRFSPRLIMWSAVYPGKVKIDVTKFQGICAWGGGKRSSQPPIH